MQKNWLEFELSILWILPAILLAVSLAYFLYRKRNVPWNRNQNIFLGTLRFLSIFLILLLCLNPLIHNVNNEIERPLIVVGIDNSLSISSVHSLEELESIISNLREIFTDVGDDKDYFFEIENLEGNTDLLDFQNPTSDISYFFHHLNKEYFGRNVAGAVLISDGIYNQGASPEYLNFHFPVYTVGIGDTSELKDAAITRVRNNEIAYAGNAFPLLVSISGSAYAGLTSKLVVSEKKKILSSYEITFQKNPVDTLILIDAEGSGVKHYTLSITAFENEITLENNQHEVFVDILESQKKILISGQSPHPDMKAINQVLEETGNYKVFTYIDGIYEKPENESFDVQILFDGVAPLPGKSGIWWINSSDTGQHLNKVNFVKVSTKGSPDQVIPVLNEAFSAFTLSEESSRMKEYPPINVPFGDYRLVGSYEVLLYQEVASFQTDKPLMVFLLDGSQKLAVTMGKGIWQWKLREAAYYGDHKLFSEMIQKTVQYLSIHENKKQFKVSPSKNLFTEGELVIFDVEIYNEIFEPLEGQPYTLEIINKNNEIEKFSFVYGSSNRIANTIALRAGTYIFQASTTIKNKKLIEKGEFVVGKLQIEQRQLQADHKILRRIASKSGGKYFYYTEMDALKKDLEGSEFTGKIHSDTSRQPLITVVWILILIGGLLCTEWIFRKVWGAY